MMVKTGIVGISGYGGVLLEELLAAQREGAASIDVAVVRSPEKYVDKLARLKEQVPEIRIFQTLEKAAAAGIPLDLMVLPTGISNHREQLQIALDAGWNVLVEKPLAGCLEDAEAMVRAAESSDRFVAVGFQDMYTEHVRQMKEVLLLGAIGDVQSIRTMGIWARPVEYYRRNAWAGRLIFEGKPVFDSPFNNALAHYLNMALFLAGADMDSPASPVRAEGVLLRAHGIESCDTACLRWETAGGPDVSVFFSHASTSPSDPELLIDGTKGQLRWKLGSPWTLSVERKQPVSCPVGKIENFRETMMRKVLRRVHDPSAPVFTVSQAREHVRAVEQAHAGMEILDFPARCVQRVSRPGKTEEIQDWMEVPGLAEAARRFMDRPVDEDFPSFLKEIDLFNSAGCM